MLHRRYTADRFPSPEISMNPSRSSSVLKRENTRKRFTGLVAINERLQKLHDSPPHATGFCISYVPIIQLCISLTYKTCITCSFSYACLKRLSFSLRASSSLLLSPSSTLSSCAPFPPLASCCLAASASSNRAERSSTCRRSSSFSCSVWLPRGNEEHDQCNTHRDTSA